MSRRTHHGSVGLTVVRAGIRASVGASSSADVKRHRRSRTIANAFSAMLVKNRLEMKARLAIVPDHVLDVLRKKARRIIAHRGKSHRQTGDTTIQNQIQHQMQILQHRRQASMQSALVSSMRSAVSSQSRRDPAIIHRYGSMQNAVLRGEVLASVRASAIKPQDSIVHLPVTTTSDDRAVAIDSSHPPCAEQQASVLSQMIFGWVTSVLAIGSKRPIRLDDLPSLKKEMLSSHLLTQFNHANEIEETRFRNNRAQQQALLLRHKQIQPTRSTQRLHTCLIFVLHR